MDRAEGQYEVLIGLEVHVQLKTRSKLFCRCSTQFGMPPNTQTCPVCLGLPGSLPVMNGDAFALALQTAIAIDCEIPAFTKWDRKNYYYPDLPKGYQISQFDLPMSREGALEISDAKGRFQPKRVRIIRAHLEEDAGKSMHDETAGSADSRIDLNRTGTPLLEIVSYPDMRSPAEARAYLSELKLLLEYLSVSDCNMQEGSLRVDANVNLHVATPEGPVATPIVEVKNMNSFRAVERALEYEIQRQLDHWRETGLTQAEVPKQTRGWDDQAEVTRAQRHKEESSDYRYFPDPDLVPVTVPAAEVERIRGELPELPAATRSRLRADYGLEAYDAEVLVNHSRQLVAYFERVAAGGDVKRASNWIQQDVLRVLNERGGTVDQFPIPPDQLAALLAKITAAELDTSRARGIFERMVEHRETLADASAALGIEQVDRSELTELCQKLLDEHPKVVEDYRSGKQQSIGSLIGKARQMNSNVNPAEVRRVLIEILSGE